MRRIIIRNIGALEDVDIRLSDINVIIGPQSLGKSTLLKICSYCAWVEKRIQLSQDYSAFANSDLFYQRLVVFHKLDRYFRKGGYLAYTSDTMSFSYDYDTSRFSFCWNEDHRWNFHRPAISYIPSERNLVAAIPNWLEVSMPQNNIRSFMKDWEFARRAEKVSLPILNLDVAYRYDDNVGDQIMLDSSRSLDFTDASSGIQSLVPLYVFVHYMFRQLDGYVRPQTIKDDMEENRLRSFLNNTLLRNGLAADEYERLVVNYMKANHCELFVEEPENNLFPPTQVRLVDWLLELTESHPGSMLSLATHSPYVLNAFLEKKNSKTVLVLYRNTNGATSVKSLTDEEQDEVYDNGIDAFFNLENLI